MKGANEAERKRKEAEELMVMGEEMSKVSSDEVPLKVRNPPLNFLSY